MSPQSGAWRKLPGSWRRQQPLGWTWSTITLGAIMGCPACCSCTQVFSNLCLFLIFSISRLLLSYIGIYSMNYEPVGSGVLQYTEMLASCCDKRRGICIELLLWRALDQTLNHKPTACLASGCDRAPIIKHRSLWQALTWGQTSRNSALCHACQKSADFAGALYPATNLPLQNVHERLLRTKATSNLLHRTLLRLFTIFHI